MNLKKLIGKVGRVLVQRFGSEIEQAAVGRIDQADTAAHRAIDRAAAKAKAAVRKRVK
jgi:hypothetical protein